MVISDASSWIEAAILCERFKQLPGPGGVFDQETVHIRKLLKALQAIDEKIERDNAKND